MVKDSFLLGLNSVTTSKNETSRSNVARRLPPTL